MFQVEFLWIVTPCNVVVGYRRFGGPCCFHLQGECQITTEKGGGFPVWLMKHRLLGFFQRKKPCIYFNCWEGWRCETSYSRYGIQCLIL